MKIPPFIVYGGVSVLLVIWWGVAFHTDPPSTASAVNTEQQSGANIPAYKQLSSFSREDLKEALSGNFTMMAALIHDWDIDARYLKSLGVPGIAVLPPEKILESQLIARTLKAKTTTPSGRFLPQTYVAASFLLAIADPSQIVALPKGFREQTTLYPRKMTEGIPLDIDRHHSESLLLSQPDLAFIAPYSLPSTVEALRNQGIKLFSINSLDTFEEICKVLMQVGEAVDRPQEALLLRTFMEAAMLATDNRLAFENQTRPLPKTLYASYHSSFSLPTRKNLTGQLLMRAGVMEHMEELEMYVIQQQWSVPIDQEKIVNFKPDCLIISSDNTQGLMKRIDSDPAFEGLRSSCRRIAYVDEDIVNSPTQYIVLAYYDLVQAMIRP